jgi:imidazolonepropionase-like amidohydrolase
MRLFMPGIVRLTAALALTLSSAAMAAPAPAAPAPPSGAEIRYTVLLAGNHAGQAVTTPLSEHEWRYTFELHDRGRGPSTSSHAVVDAQGMPLLFETTGTDYFKNPVDERFERTGMKVSWRNASETGERVLTAPAFFPSLNGPPQETELLARALLRSPDHRIDLLPAGRETIEELGSLTVKAGAKSETIHLYALSGSGFEPGYLWLDSQGRLFASTSNWSGIIREGWEDAVPEIGKALDARKAERTKAIAQRLARHPHGALVFVHARLLDPARGLVRPGTTVVISGDRITAVGDDGQVAVPAGAEVVDAQGKTLMPGLWDMHVHLSTLDGLLHLAAGVTTVRDMANDTDFLLDMRRRVDAGEALGPHILLAGFIDGPGPYAGPSKVLVATKEEALKAVDRYKELGYEQVKLYSSLDPALVPPIIERAHHLGMRVSGHIPNGMTAEQAVRAGFDEIQHVNFLFLNFLSGFDTRTPARFTQLGEHAAELDLGSAKVKAFLALLKEKKTVSDPTVNAFEGMLTGRDGQLDPGLAPVADRLPPQVRRELFGGGLPVPPGMDQRYRDSFRALLNMVRALHDTGIPIVAGTDSMAGFGLQRELELYGQAGIPNLDILRAATIVPAQVMKRDKDFASLETGKMADVILVDGQPDQKISDIRRVVLTVKGGVVYDPAALYTEIGVKPVE